MRRLLALAVAVACLALASAAEAAPRWVYGYVEGVVESTFGFGSTHATTTACRTTSPKRYRCSFRARRGAWRYRGSVRVYPFRAPDGDELFDLAFRWYRGSCGGLGSALPFQINTLNIQCGTAWRWVGNWYSRGKPMPASYVCSLRSAPATARCHKGARSFSFKYPE